MDNTAKERMRRYRNKKRNGTVTSNTVTGETVTPRYDHDLTVREILTLHSQRSQDQVDRFPDIPLPFGEAYYKALREQA